MVGIPVATNCRGLSAAAEKGQNLVKSAAIMLIQRSIDTVRDEGVVLLYPERFRRTRLLICTDCDDAGCGIRPIGSGNPSFTTDRKSGLFEGKSNTDKEVKRGINKSQSFLASRL